MPREIEPDDFSKFQWKKPEPPKPEEIKPVEPEPTQALEEDPILELTQRGPTYHPPSYSTDSYSKKIFGEEFGFFLTTGTIITMLVTGTITTLRGNANTRDKIVQDIETAKQMFLEEQKESPPYGQPTEFKDIAPYILINKQIPTEFEFKKFIQEKTKEELVWLGRYPTANGEKKPAKLETTRTNNRR
jgi:hypothetical protein